eukprot:9204323-Pyramimonas_sp.AAC.1
MPMKRKLKGRDAYNIVNDSFAGPEVDTNTKIGGVPPPREENPDLGDDGSILASEVTEILPPPPNSRIVST